MRVFQFQDAFSLFIAGAMGCASGCQGTPGPVAERPAPANLPVQTESFESPLDCRFQELTFQGETLRQVFEKIGETPGVRLDVDWKNLTIEHIDPKMPVHAKLRNISLRKAIEVILDSAMGERPKPRYHVSVASDGAIQITSRSQYQKQNTVTLTYDVRDILQSLSTPGVLSRKVAGIHLCEMITENIDPDSWNASEAVPATISEQDGFLTVRQTRDNHISLENLLREVRTTLPASRINQPEQ